VLDMSNLLSSRLPVEPRAVGAYVGAALVVELAAALLGTRRVTRFAVACGAGIATVGLAVDWAWNLRAWQPWRAALVPEALLLGIPVAVAASLLGCRLAGRRMPPWASFGAVAVIIVALAWPLARPVGEVVADVELDPAGRVAVTLTPADAADGARWFQWSSWQGGDLQLGNLHETSPGRWTSDGPVPRSGANKTLLRLHRGHQMMTVPVYLPADPEIGEPEVPAVDRTVPFARETRYLLRETKSGAAWFAWVVYGLLAVVAACWLTGFALATGWRGVRRQLNPIGALRPGPGAPASRTSATVAPPSG
jgi:hypothetical protein